MFRMSESHFPVEPDELCMALRLWIRGSPRWIWQRDAEYERARAEKRHDPEKAPDPQRDLAAYLADRFATLGWTVTRPDPGNIFADRINDSPEER